jgi:8-oxo-dGTP pyrophosphatase MutT (NUDIX family)
MPDAVKVLIYAVWGSKLLVFDEPDFPEVPLQMPGGTVEAGEDLAVSAAREFREETGLEPGSNLEPLFSHDYRFERDGYLLVHRRHFFLLPLSGDFPETWLHWEQTPSGGGPPICFRLHWLSLEDVEAHFSLSMRDPIAALFKACQFQSH